VLLLLTALAAGATASPAEAQPPSLPPGTPLPQGFQLPPGWTYDQASGQFRQAPTPAPATAAPAPAPAATCADLRAQTAGLERDTAGLQHQVQDLLTKLRDTERRHADLQKQRDLVCAAAPGVAGAPPAAPAKTARVPLAAIASYFSAAVQGAQVKLHNYQTQDSWVQFGPGLGNYKMPLAVPEGTFTVNAPFAVTARYWVNDVRSRRSALDYSGGRFVLTVDFANSGREIVVAPIVGVSLPTVGTTNAQVVATLTPALDGSGRPSFGPVAARASGEIACSGGGLAAICNSLVPVARPYLQRQIETAIQNAFGGAEVRNRVGAAVRAALDTPEGRQRIQAAAGVTVGRITATRFASDALLIDYQ
jgi:hypothetical protein